MTNAEKIFENNQLGLYTFFDKTFNAHNSPFCARNDREACKVCRDILKMSDDSITINADVIALYRVGIFDQFTGEIVPECTHLIDLTEFVVKKECDFNA